MRTLYWDYAISLLPVVSLYWDIILRSYHICVHRMFHM